MGGLLSILISYFPNLKHFSTKQETFKVGLPPSKKICVDYLIESPIKMMKHAFYFILKAFFIL